MTPWYLTLQREEGPCSTSIYCLDLIFCKCFKINFNSAGLHVLAAWRISHKYTMWRHCVYKHSDACGYSCDMSYLTMTRPRPKEQAYHKEASNLWGSVRPHGIYLTFKDIMMDQFNSHQHNSRAGTFTDKGKNPCRICQRNTKSNNMAQIAVWMRMALLRSTFSCRKVKNLSFDDWARATECED